MQRVPVTLDDDLMAELDQLISKRGYQNRSEAIRDLARAGSRMGFSPSTQAYNGSPVLISPGRSLAQSLGSMPSVTHLAKLENGQSAGCAASPCFTGLK